MIGSVLWLIVGAAMLPNTVEAVVCLFCSDCFNVTDTTATINNCTSCGVFNQRYTNGGGNYLFSRGCAETIVASDVTSSGVAPNSCVSGVSFTTCLETCNTDRCNIGTGIPNGTDPLASTAAPPMGPSQPSTEAPFLCIGCAGFQDDQLGRNCLDDPNAYRDNAVVCPGRSCASFRQSYQNGAGLFSFVRGCASQHYHQVPKDNRCADDPQFRVCLQTCSTPFCNTGAADDLPLFDPARERPRGSAGAGLRLLSSPLLLMTYCLTALFAVPL